MVLATAAGAVLGLLTVLTVLDFGFLNVLSRPFDPTADWHLADSVVHLLTGSLGRPGAIAALVGFLVLVAALLVAVTLAARRVATVVVRRRPRPGMVVGRAGPGLRRVPRPRCGGRARRPGHRRERHRAGRWSAAVAWSPGRASSARSRPRARRDPLRGVAPDQLLAGLRGKDVVVAFVESYGRSTLTAPDYAGPMAATLDGATRRLTAAGFGARSAYLTSPTSGGGSWLAHATFLSGLWVDSERRHYDA